MFGLLLGDLRRLPIKRVLRFENEQTSTAVSRQPSTDGKSHPLGGHSLPINKPCELEDFYSPDLLPIMRQVYQREIRDMPADWPRGVEYRKYWEVAMAARALHLLHRGERNMALGVGAGMELTTFYLTDLFRWVFATDLYLNDDGKWPTDAFPLALVDPESARSDLKFNARRLVMQHMDGRNLRYEDESFDFIYSSSAIEHFGGWEDVSRAAGEMGRVLRPGGILSLSTEYRISGPPGGRGLPNILTFDGEELKKLIVEPSGCQLVEPLQLRISQATMDGVVSFAEAVRDVERVRQGGPAGWSRYPHIVLEYEGYVWTSIHLALRKL